MKPTLDHDLLAEAANILEITEIEVLRIARYKWYSQQETAIEYEDLESLYGMFIMGHTSLPLWARDYIRKIVWAWHEKDEEAIHELLEIPAITLDESFQ
jgi:hypothetical protein